MNLKYKEGTKLICGEIKGVVVKNYKLFGDICVKWETGLESSYDVEWLDENCTIDGVKIYRTNRGEIGIYKSTFGVYMNGNADVNFWTKDGMSKCSKEFDLEIVSLEDLTEKELEEYELVMKNKRY